MKTKFSLSLLATVLFAGVFGTIFSTALGVSPVYGITGVMALSAIPTGATGSLMAGISVEMWVEQIIGNLFKDNSFLNKCFDESANVLGGAIVHIPQAGALPNVVKNRSVYPAVSIQRTDNDANYVLEVYTTDPTHIPLASTLEISYDKMNSVLAEHIAVINEVVADDILFKWAPTVAGNVLRTTGAAVSTALAPTATGTRLKFLKDDLRRAQAAMNKAKIAKEDRYALMPTDILSQLMEDPDLIKRDYGNEVDIVNGVVLKLYGFNIMERSDTTVYSTAALPKAPGALGATTDNLAVICWQKNAVAKALGTVDFFENIKDALYHGDVYSVLLKAGARQRRLNGAGVIAIVQA
jgi:Phage capsid protein